MGGHEIENWMEKIICYNQKGIKDLDGLTSNIYYKKSNYKKNEGYTWNFSIEYRLSKWFRLVYRYGHYFRCFHLVDLTTALWFVIHSSRCFRLINLAAALGAFASWICPPLGLFNLGALILQGKLSTTSSPLFPSCFCLLRQWKGGWNELYI